MKKKTRVCIDCGCDLFSKSNGKRCPSCAADKIDADKIANRQRATAKRKAAK